VGPSAHTAEARGGAVLLASEEVQNDLVNQRGFLERSAVSRAGYDAELSIRDGFVHFDCVIHRNPVAVADDFEGRRLYPAALERHDERGVAAVAVANYVGHWETERLH